MQSDMNNYSFLTNPSSQALADIRRLQGVAESIAIRSGEDIVHIVATSKNSSLVLSAESFLSTYWLNIWNEIELPISIIIQKLGISANSFNRETLYRTLIKFMRDDAFISTNMSDSKIDELAKQIANDMDLANQCEPPDLSQLPPFIAVAIPQHQEYITISLAVECLCLITGYEINSPLKKYHMPVLSNKLLEAVMQGLFKRYCQPVTKPENQQYCDRVVQTIRSW